MRLRPGVVRAAWGGFVAVDLMLEAEDYPRDVGAHAVREVVMMWRLAFWVLVSRTVIAIVRLRYSTAVSSEAARTGELTLSH